jgi:ADP-ribose pyrophosphatase YjhB (NUDIX family)
MKTYVDKDGVELGATEPKPDFTGQYSYRGKVRIHHIDYEWFDVPSKKDLPDLPWQQVYMVGNLNGSIPLVRYEEDPDNLPGGGTEPGETVEETARREAIEELNCKVSGWEPLGYQANYENGHFIGYQLRIYAKLDKLGVFVTDPGGPVIGQRYISIDQLAVELKWPKTGQRLQELAKKYFIKSSYKSH